MAKLEVDEDTGEVVLLQSIRTVLRLIGFVLFCAVIIMSGMAISQSRLNTKINKLNDAVGNVQEASEETRETARNTRDQVNAAVERFSDNSDDSAENNQLEAVFRAVFHIEEILVREFGG